MDQNFLRGLGLEQYKTVVEKKQENSTTRFGIVESVNVLESFAIVAVPGGDSNFNTVEVKLLNISENAEEVDGETKTVKSSFTRYRARMPEPLEPGTHVQITFISGRIEPVITGTVPVLKDPVEPPTKYIAVDKDGNGFRFLDGGSDTYWTKQNAARGFRFAPYSQNTVGGKIVVANGFKLKKLLNSKTPSTAVIKEALKDSTPSGVSPWVDKDGVGHVGMFGDIIHSMAKEIDVFALGSSQPVTSFLKDPLNDLVESLDINITSGTENFIFPEKPEFRVSPLVYELAVKEAFEFKSKLKGYFSLIEQSNILYTSNSDNSKSLLTYIKNNYRATDDFKYLIAASLTAGVYTEGLTVSKVGGPYFPSTALVENLNTFDPTTDNNINCLNSLNGYGSAWINLICALRLSILGNSQVVSLRTLLNSYQLKLYKLKDLSIKTTDGNTNLIVFENLFGFNDNNYGSSILSEKSNFYKLSLNSEYTLSSNKNYTYGDVVHANLKEISNTSQTWLKSNNFYVPNVTALKDNSNTRFVDRLYLNTTGIPHTENALNYAVAGGYAAQVRTLVQEILYIIKEYNTDLEAFTGRVGSPFKSSTTPLKLTDKFGNTRQVTSQLWTSSFIIYLMLRLFNGDPGKDLAQNFISLYSAKVSAISKNEFLQMLTNYQSSISDPLALKWWTTTVERYTFVANVLAKSQLYWRV